MNDAGEHMRVLIVGASGLIGSTLTARLAAQGHEIVAIARRAGRAATGVAWRALDVGQATRPEDWFAHLQDIDAVVNCAGLLQDMPGNATAGVHAIGATALFRACERVGVRRVIHLSAIGVDRETPSGFSRSKRAGDEALMALDLDWVILRPAVVIGRAAHGGSALLRGLAALAVMPVMPDTAPIQVVHLDDLVDAVVFFLKPDAPSRHAIEVVGPRRYGFDEVVSLLRRWLGWRPARPLPVPSWLARIMFRAGDFAALLGWQPPVRSTAQLEMIRGATGDTTKLTRLTGIEPRDVEAALAREPASVQERWFARLYFLKPVTFVTLALFWFATGVVSLGPGWERGIELVMEGGTSRTVAVLATLSGALSDIVIGIAIAFRRTTRFGLYAGFFISIAYAIIGTILVPRLWFDPLGPMLKIGPIMVLLLVAIAIHEER